MILRLRRAHRSAFVALAVGLPVLLASAWSARRAPVVGQLDEELLPAPPTPESPYHVLGLEELVYWIPERDSDPTELPVEAELAGTVRSGALQRTPPAGKQAITYSLPHDLLSPNVKNLAVAPGRVKEGE